MADRLGVRAVLEALGRVLVGGSEPADLETIGADGWDLQDRLEARMARLGLGHLPLDRPMAAISGGEATRVSVKLGRSSVNTIEVMQGLAVGDSVIISDMSAYDSAERLRLK